MSRHRLSWIGPSVRAGAGKKLVGIQENIDSNAFPLKSDRSIGWGTTRSLKLHPMCENRFYRMHTAFRVEGQCSRAL